MAPKTSAHARSFTKQKSPASAMFAVDLQPDDTATGALQHLQGTDDDEWQGIDEEEQEEGEGRDASDDEGIEVITEKKGKTVLPKDAEEEELERIIFGDSAGFREGLDAFSLQRTAAVPGEDSRYEKDEEEDEGLGEVADHELFFFDSGPTAQPAGSLVVAETADTDDEDDKPAWEDSDDERVVVSLASVPQLRKLRETAEDDMVNGKEYARRLRKQYERLYPAPEWATHATGKAKRKRGRMADDESDESASDMDVDEDDLSTLPLARLLKNADLLSRTSTSTKRRKLQAGTIDIARLKDVSGPGPSAITSLSFHPTYPLLLTSGTSGMVQLYHVNPSGVEPNPLLTSMHLKRTSLTTTAFHPSPNDSRIFLSARRRYFHVWDLTAGTVEKVSRVYGHQHEQRTMERFSLSPNGKYMALKGSSRKGGGVINILDSKTLQWVSQARADARGGISDFCWWGDSSGLVIAAHNGEVTEWSIRDGLIGRWQDEGAVGITTITTGGKSGRDGWIGGDRWVAVGSSSGIVNVYDRRAWGELSSSKDRIEDANNGIPKTPKPLRALDNLTTPVSNLTFSSDGQILAMSSMWKHNSLRLVHMPSATVYSNWPTLKTPLGRVVSIAWGKPSEQEAREGSFALLAVGLETGRVRMWEVRA